MKKLFYCISWIFAAALFLCLSMDLLFPYVALLVRGLLLLITGICLWMSWGYLKRFLISYNRKKKETLYNLLFRSGWKSMLVNMCTTYRIVICPVLLVMLFNDHPAFKWVLLSAFITDALDGFLARAFRVTSKLGAKLDSLADDILFLVSVTAILYMNSEIFSQNYLIISLMFLILFIKMLFLWILHNKIISGLHTYSTKAAAFFQAVFFLHAVFLVPSQFIFMVMVVLTILAMVEEIMIIILNKELKPNTKSLFFNTNP